MTNEDQPGKRKELKETQEHHFYLTQELFNELKAKLKAAEEKSKALLEEYNWTDPHRSDEKDGSRISLEMDRYLTGREVAYLDRKLQNVVIVDGLNLNTSIVEPGAEVDFRDENDGNVFTYTLISLTNLKRGYLSIESPVGKSLLGNRIGETVSVAIPDEQNRRLTILDIRRPDFSKSQLEPMTPLST